MASNQSPPNPSTSKFAVECPPENPIEYIEYNGEEHLVPPPRFADLITKNAEKIQWRQIVGQMTLLDLYDDQDSAEVKEAKKILQTTQAVRDQAREKVEPVAGPWASVAKLMYQSLQEIDVLLDVLRISRTPYLKPEQVASTMPEDLTGEQLNKTKGFHLASRRKAFDEAKKLLEMFKHNNRDINAMNEKSQFFDELKKMRENWRIRKVNELIFGDLGYRLYGPKFQQSEVFDIFWNPKVNNQTGKGSVQIQVPKHLQRRTKLSVSVMADSQENHDLIFAQKDFSYNFDDSSSMVVPWENALEWAQESLICRDIFIQLTKEAVAEKHVCIITDNSLTVCLSDGMLLKFEMHYFPFQDGDMPEVGDPYLNMSMRELFVSDVIKPKYRPQLFVGAPLSTLPEALDLRGAQGLSAEEIKSRYRPPQPLLTRMIRRSDHFILIDRVTEVLNRHMVLREDPSLTWKWLRCTSIFSIISCQLQSRPDSHNRFNFMIQIGSNEVMVLTKENMVIQCFRQMPLLSQAIHTMASSCQLYTTSNFARQYGWQVLHANNNAYGKDGVPAPTLYACNQSCTKRLFAQFFADHRLPKVFLKYEDWPKPNDDPLSDEQMSSEEFLLSFRPVNLNRIPGSSFMKKIEYILTMFRN
ncbi:unnamed protein product [Bursaphelenchus xylophilus]|uniref:(pine wood nematode) hypothetical protein n=1 Tax=Bursaphelenchus xylophilus TaxID=6326 RepID=A0A1I7RTB8_BURXY|nr:unnamed protein product [Bursaphelenchus xylophilus]CAG9122510.1 unnamed protein product [Bursaphelenchus xylophilus]